jgi:adenylate kinase family enzyme
VKRISIIGCGGSGKSTLSHILSEKKGLPIYHLDTISYKANWAEADPDTFNAAHKQWIMKDAWIIDGAMIDTLDERLKRSDTVIFLDMPRWLCVFRIFKRLISEYGKTRDDMAEGCKESFDWPFLMYVLKFRKNIRPQIMEILENNKNNCKVTVIKTKSELDNWIKTL